MKFPKLTIENFLAITEAELSLADRGLVLIQGKNSADTSANSNGAGKSSIADALCWCWFGTTARGETGDDVINNRVGKNCLVASTVVDGAITYIATRHRKHKTGKNSLTLIMSDGFKTTDLTKGTDKLTQEIANQIIGSSLEVFAGSIYAGQEKMPDLPAMTDKQLKLLIEEAAGVTVLEAAYKTARETATIAASDLSMAVSAWNAATVEVTRIDDSILRDTVSLNDWSAVQTRALNALGSSMSIAVAEARAAQAKAQAIDLMQVQSEIAAIDAKIVNVAKENDELRRLGVDVARAEANVRTGLQAVASASLLRDRCKDALDGVSHKIGCPCDECGRPLTQAELAAAIQSATQRVTDAERALVEQVDLLARAQEAQKTAQEAHDRFLGTLTDLSKEQAQRAILESLVRQRADHMATAKHHALDAQRIKREIDAKGAEINPFEKRLDESLRTKTRLENEVKRAREAVDAAQIRLDIENEVVKVFAPAGVRARVLDEVTPYLNAQTSRYLGVLSDGNINATWSTLARTAKGELREKFSIDVESATGGKKFGLLSGGEKRKVRIASALALQDLVATRASKPIDLFIGDEIDDALDPAGLERLMVILEEKARERGSVFVISHNDLKDSIRNVLTIEKMASGETRITESVC